MIAGIEHPVVITEGAIILGQTPYQGLHLDR
jgi:hypothetical protein